MEKGTLLSHNLSKYIEWELPVYPLQKRKKLTIYSPDFCFANTSWNFRLMLNDPDEPDSASVTLLKERSVVFQDFVTGHVGFKKTNGDEYTSRYFCYESYSGSKHGIKKFVMMSDLFKEKSEIMFQGKLTVFCWLRFPAPGCRTAVTQTMPPQSQNATTQTLEENFSEDRSGKLSEYESAKVSTGVENLAQSFQNLLISEEDADTTIQVKNKEFRVHRLVLVARCPVFAKMFKHDTIERSTGVVEISDNDPEAFQKFLVYLYSGRIDDISMKNVFELFKLGDKYNMEEIRSQCIEFLKSELSVDNFCDVATLAIRHKESSLITPVTDFFKQNVQEIVVTAKWLNFLKEYPVESNEMYIKSVGCVQDIPPRFTMWDVKRAVQTKIQQTARCNLC